MEKEAAAYFEKLKAASNDEISEMHATLARKKADEKEARHPLNAPRAHADAGIYDYYGKAAYWTWEEGIALLLQRNPIYLSIETIERSDPIPNIAREFARLYEL